ncbi:hypothetical protein K8B33_11535 [Alcanivorax sp. JB21]|uniref:hypothetical protein n=1 Tax=Alcanivorax limicola TaxID=2874102 RepID=UPI001CBD6A07|nr:hypothetical protein [Alcanivorax limicola]MBZ2189733.1 hypothetical protein [Alcanivorax limicola]
MNQDRDLPLGNIGDVPLDDDRPGRPGKQPGQGAGAGAGQGAEAAGKPARRTGGGGGQGGGEPPRRSRRAAAPRPASGGGGSGLWIAATVVLLLITLGMGAFMYQELSAVRAQMDTRISESSEQLGSLASQLSATDESLSQSSGKVEERLALHMSEIRKLWDVTNVRNRRWIEENQKALKALQDKQSAQERTVASLRTDLAEAKKAAETAQEQAASARREVQQANVTRNQMQTQIDLSQETIKQLESRAAAQQRALNEVREALNAGGEQNLPARLSDIESAINAFDAYRREVNNRLDGLERR